MYQNKKIIAVIPARGGSKRIPKKNILPFAGKPMIAWTIESARSSKYIDTILVSTDCESIKKVALKYKADVPFMRSGAFDDKTSVAEATLFSYQQSENYYGKFDVILQLMPNCPLRNATDIDSALESFFKNDNESQISFFKFGWMNPWWAHTLDGNVPTPLFKDSLMKRSQDLKNLFCPTGAIWIIKPSVLKKYKTFYSPSYKGYEINWISGIDIDDLNDLKMAEALKNIDNIK